MAGACAAAIAIPAQAQDNNDNGQTSTTRTAATPSPSSEPPVIIVTAQRRNEALQNVPIAVSAFDAQALEKQQIKTTSDLQLTLPNVTFTKTNFTSASFTIRGIGDLCTGVTCDAATAIAMNDQPLFATRIFESEFYDLAQVQVLRGPQGTLFGRNATSGVVDFITAKPDMTGIHASLEGDYGNYNSKKVKGMINLPITDTLAVRAAGYYLKRDGFTENLYNNTRIDGRDMYGFRGSLRWEPTSTTQIDLMGQFFREKDDRMRIQKQYCQPDPTGVLGCLNGVLTNGVTNSNSTLAGVLTSQQLLALNGVPAPLNSLLALGDLSPSSNAFANALNPADPRKIYTAFTPQYYTRETILQASIKQELGGGLNFKLSGTYQDVAVDSLQDYNNALQNRAVYQPTFNNLAAAAGGQFGPGLAAVITPFYNAFLPQGANGPVCTSLPTIDGTGIFGGHSACSQTPLSFDRSVNTDYSYDVEGILSSDWDGKFNFLLGGIYAHFKNTENSYYVDSFGLDYFSGLIGALNTTAQTGPVYLGPPMYQNHTLDYTLNSYGIFGEAYYQASDKLKLTLGLRFNHDAKDVSARTTVFNFLVPYGLDNAFASPYAAGFDADPATTCSTPGTAVPGAIGSAAGCEAVQSNQVSFSRVTGRAVIDYQITPNNLLYFSYSRGYKSGGINPPLSPVFDVPVSFRPESIDAFELGSKNRFGPLEINATAFYYKYKDLQLSRIVARTSVNDNVNANIYGAELEAVIKPAPAMTVNANFSYLHTAVAGDTYLSNPRDFGGGRADAVIIKDISNGANCAVAPNTAGNAAGANAFVNTINAGIAASTGAQLQGTVPFPANGGIASTGAFSVCSALAQQAAAVGNLFDPAGITVYSSGIPVNIKGNKLPGAPDFKASAGVQYVFGLGSLTLTPRFDAILTSATYGSVFNGIANRIPSYTQFNAQVQLDGPDDRWFIRGYIQNIANSNAITGEYVTDQSSGNYTNIFTLDPRRYGIAAGFKF
ncbi:TonB-dependent receptor [Porphyrobacter algicida]|uniref:TonB-dependent receptor n=2 Tax=Qipengyuania algicida TaxID=1836209 RepID=A0A845AKD9_9SPHN|nr:TonB-dependent receptor [Qipengyuania algicida]